MTEYDTNNEALRGLVDRQFLKSQRYQQQQMRAVTAGAHPKILLFNAKMIRKCAGLGVPMFAHTIVRTAAHQLIEFTEGNSKDSPADGVWPHRKHASDIIHGTKAWALTEKQWLLIGHVGKEVAKDNGIRIKWGGDFKPLSKAGLGWDPAHWELDGWKLLE